MRKAFLLLVLCAAPLSGQTLLVANQTDHTLSFVDPATLKQTLALDVDGITGHEVVAIGNRAFVPIYGNSGVGKPGTDGDTIDVIGIPTHKIVDRIKFAHGVRPHCAVYDAKRDLLYVTTEIDHAVTIINPHTLKIVGQIPTGQPESHMFALAHDGRRGYTANVGPGTVSVLDMDAHRTLAVVPIAASIQRIAISNDDKHVFTADQTKPQLAVLDTATNKLVQPIALPALAYGTAATPDGKYLLAAIPTLNQVAVIDLQTMAVVRRVNVGKTPLEVLVRPDGKTAYVSCTESATVSAIDLASWNVKSADAGKKADGLAWAH